MICLPGMWRFFRKQASSQNSISEKFSWHFSYSTEQRSVNATLKCYDISLTFVFFLRGSMKTTRVEAGSIQQKNLLCRKGRKRNRTENIMVRVRVELTTELTDQTHVCLCNLLILTSFSYIAFHRLN